MWSGNDSYETKKLRTAARLKDGQCTYCKPHRGENYGQKDGKFVGGKFRPSKDKTRK